MSIDVKAPEVAGVPQEAITGELLRGRGPRRGNLEALLRYWRPIMKKPGGFRRCVVILADHPELYPPQRICAWLHHEVTGKWPNEGNHHGRGGKKRKRKLTGSSRRLRGRKDLLGANGAIEVSSFKMAVRESREFNGILVQPIAGRQNVLEIKAAMFRAHSSHIAVAGPVYQKRVGVFGSSSGAGQAAQAVGTMFLPGDLSDVRSPIRSQIYETLTPGGGGGLRLPSARRLIRGTGRGARNKFRCPPGFENGGTFTNAQFSTCGAQILGIPSVGPGSPTQGAQRALARLAANAQLVREIGDLRSNASAYDIIRAAQIPVAPKKTSPTLSQSSIDLVLSRIDTEQFSPRVVRRDGVILEPVVSLQALSKLDEFDDLADGAIIDRYTNGQIGKDLVPAFSTGLRSTFVAIPDVGAVRISRVGGELSPEERASLIRTFPTSVSRSADLPDPSAAIRSFADRSNGRFEVEFGTMKNNRFNVEKADNELIRVQAAGGKILTVPRWVYETFLSRSAPRRAKTESVWEIVSEGKGLKPFRDVQSSIDSSILFKSTYYNSIEERAAFFKFMLDDEHINGKALGRRIGGDGTNTVGAAGGRARAFFDPGISRYRCPPGTRYGGRITDQFGRNCGYSLPRNIVNNLVDLGMRVEDRMERRRQRRGVRDRVPESTFTPEFNSRLDDAYQELDGTLDALSAVLDKTEDNRPGTLGRTLGEATQERDLTPDEQELLNGDKLRSALENLRDVLNEQDFDNANIDEIRKAYKRVERAANMEAGRRTAKPARTGDDRRQEGGIANFIIDLIRRLLGLGMDNDGGGAGPRRDEDTDANVPGGAGRPRVPGGQVIDQDGVRPRIPGGQGGRPRVPGGRPRVPGGRLDDEERRRIAREVRNMSDEELLRSREAPRFDGDTARATRRQMIEDEIRRRGLDDVDLGDDMIVPRIPERPRSSAEDVDDVLDDLQAQAEEFDARSGGMTGDFVRQVNDDDLDRFIDVLDNADVDDLGDEGKEMLDRLRQERELRVLDELQRRAEDYDIRSGGMTGNFANDLDDAELDRYIDILDKADADFLGDEGREMLDVLRNERERRGPRTPAAPDSGRPDGAPEAGRPRRPQETERPRRPRRPRDEQGGVDLGDDMIVPEVPPRPEDGADFGEGSMPDDRSMRNVRNRFPRNGLPDEAYWRDENYTADDKAELERRFGRYYDENNALNDRGRFVNNVLRREREGEDRRDVPERAQSSTDEVNDVLDDLQVAAEAFDAREGGMTGDFVNNLNDEDLNRFIDVLERGDTADLGDEGREMLDRLREERDRRGVVVTEEDLFDALDDLQNRAENYDRKFGGRTGDFVNDLNDAEVERYLNVLDNADPDLLGDEGRDMRDRLRAERDRRGLGGAPDAMTPEDADDAMNDFQQRAEEFDVRSGGMTGDLVNDLDDAELDRYIGAFENLRDRGDSAFGDEERDILDRMIAERGLRRGSATVRPRGDGNRVPENINVGRRAVGGRRRRADVPELESITPEQRRNLAAQAQKEFDELARDLARKMGRGDDPNGFTESELREWLRRVPEGNERRLAVRQYNDFLELNELNRRLENAEGADDIDAALRDHVARLAPNRRNSIVGARDAAPGDFDRVPGERPVTPRSPDTPAPDRPATPAAPLTPEAPAAPDNAAEPIRRRLPRNIGDMAGVDIVNAVGQLTDDDLLNDDPENFNRVMERLGEIRQAYINDNVQVPSELDAALRRMNDLNQRRNRTRGLTGRDNVLNNLGEDARNAVQGIEGDPDFWRNDVRMSFLKENIDILQAEVDAFNARGERPPQRLYDALDAVNDTYRWRISPDDADVKRFIDDMVANGPDNNANERLNQIANIDVASLSEADLDRLNAAMEEHRYVFGLNQGQFAGIMSKIQSEKIKRIRAREHQYDRPLAERDNVAIEANIRYLEDLVDAGVIPDEADELQIQPLRDVLAARVEAARQVNIAAESVPTSNPGKIRKVYDWVRERKQVVKRRQDKMHEMAKRFWGDEQPFRLGATKREARAKWDSMSVSEREDYVRNMFLHGKEIKLDTVTVNGVTYQKFIEPKVTDIRFSRNGLPSDVNGNMILRLKREDGTVVKEMEFRGYPEGGFHRSFSDTKVSHDSFGVRGNGFTFTDPQNGITVATPVNFNTGGGAADQFNSNAYLFYRGLGYSSVKVGVAAGDGQGIWAVGGFRAPDYVVSGLNSPNGGMASLLANYDSYKAKIARGQVPSIDEMAARMAIGDDVRADRVRTMLASARNVSSVDQMPDHADYWEALKPDSPDGKGRNTAFLNYLKSGASLGKGMSDDDRQKFISEINSEVGQDVLSEADLDSHVPYFASRLPSGELKLSELKLPPVRRDRVVIPVNPNRDATPNVAERGDPRDVNRFGRHQPINPDYNPEGLLSPTNPTGAPKHVAIGSNGMNTQADADRHVATGGALDLVPDAFLAKALRANADGSGSGRFTSSNPAAAANAVNESVFYKDNVTGKVYGVKYSAGEGYFANEGYNEMYGAEVARRFGFYQGQFRFGGPPNDNARGRRANRTPEIVFEAHQNFYGDGIGNAARVNPQYSSLPAEDRVNFLMLDMALASSDRHKNNWMVATDANGNPLPLPIDHGGLNVYGGSGSPSEEMRLWLAGRNRHIGDSRFVHDIPRNELTQIVEQFQRNARERDAALGNLRDIADEIRSNSPYAMRTAERDTFQSVVDNVDARYAWLRDAPVDDVVNLLLTTRRP